MDLLEGYFEGGFAVMRGLLDVSMLAIARAEADRLLAVATERGGSRNALQGSPILRQLASSIPILGLAQEVLGMAAMPVKLTIFDKTTEANWKVPWHQDLTIAVRERMDVSGFGPWSLKAGLPHVRAPVEVLTEILAIRVHLDDTPTSNGALRVLAGSHRGGRLSDDELTGIATRYSLAAPELEAGDAFLMSPLLVHASSAADRPGRRRVLHYEFASKSLPGGLQWA